MGNHYIPREYLRGFAHPSYPNALWQFDKKEKTFTAEPASIDKIAQQRSFYDADTERRLNELVEIPGNRVLRKLRSGDLDLEDEERASLSVYIATMLMRVPHNRAQGAEMLPQVLAQITSESRDQIRTYADARQISQETAEKRLAEVDAAESKFSAETPAKVRDEIRSPWPTEEVIHLVYGMHWRFVLARNGQYFVTTDNPAFFFSCYGLGTEHSELTFPISSGLAIFGSGTPVAKSDRISHRAQFVKEANRRLINEATRFIYCGSKASWIATVAAKKNPYLSRIRWCSDAR